MTGKSPTDGPHIDSLVREAAATSHPGHFSGTDRYQLVRKVGEGGFGEVYEVIDRKQGGRLALKALRQPYAARLYRFKREFRALSETAHLNLVRLYELSAAGRDLFFTMELIEGVTLLEHVAGNPERARAAFKQLAEGLSALHAHKTLHRDIKPSNVMVDSAGRVVLLDFGLALDLDAGDTSELAGTPLYMSPEQCAEEPLTEASDWYALGVLLFEALTGRTPFDGSIRHLLETKQQEDAPPPGSFASGIPDDLDQLCRALLLRDPKARPSGDQVLRCLSAAPAVRREAAAPFVGRAEELAVLEAEAAGDGCRMVLARGPSGIGKSALLRHFVDELKRRRPEVVVLAGRCYERESVPYKALDAVCDALARHLKRLPEMEAAALLPREPAALARLFPVMRQVPVFLRRAGASLDGVDGTELRGRGAAALRELLARLADRYPVVVCIDDLQWGDVDSAALLADLLRGPDAPAVVWLASFREEEATTSPILKRLAQLRGSVLRDLDVRELRLQPLGAAEARQLAAALLAETRGDEVRAESIAAESGGSPFFVQEMVRRGRGELSHWGAGLEGAARRVLEAVAVAARPIEAECLAAAAGVGDELRDVLSQLRVERLVRGRESDGEQLIESYHDRIRQAVAAAIPPERLGAIHLSLAAALEKHQRGDAAEIGQHLAEGGDSARAFSYLQRAAETAAAALAFDEAVRLYRRAIEVSGARDPALQLAFAEALSAAGHGLEAARVWLAALDGVDEGRQLELRRRAAEDLLVSGHLEEGRVAMASVLSRLGVSVPRGKSGAIAWVIWGRARRALFGQRFSPRSGPLDEREDHRLHTVAGLELAAWLVDPILAAGIQAQYLPLALKSGDRYHASIALVFESLVSAGGGVKSQAATHRLVEAARAASAGLEVPAAGTILATLEGTVAVMEARWPEALQKLDLAERIDVGSWPGHASVRMMVTIMRVIALFWLGRAGEVLRLMPAAITLAEERGHLTAWLWLRILEGWALGFAGRIVEARAVAEEVRARMPKRGFELPEWYLEYTQVQFALEEGDAEGAWQALLAARRKTRYGLSSEPQRILAAWISSAVALARARDATLRKPMLAEARRGCSRLERHGVPWAASLACGLRAGIASIELVGDGDEAVRRLTEAERLLSLNHLPLAAAAVRAARGRLAGDEQLCQAAVSWAAAQGVSRAALWMQMPGAWEA